MAYVVIGVDWNEKPNRRLHPFAGSVRLPRKGRRERTFPQRSCAAQAWWEGHHLQSLRVTGYDFSCDSKMDREHIAPRFREIPGGFGCVKDHDKLFFSAELAGILGQFICCLKAFPAFPPLLAGFAANSQRFL